MIKGGRRFMLQTLRVKKLKTSLQLKILTKNKQNYGTKNYKKNKTILKSTRDLYWTYYL